MYECLEVFEMIVTFIFEAVRDDTSRVSSRTLIALAVTCHDVALDMYRNLANGLLRRCRALPLKGFQHLTDLTTPQFICSLDKATRCTTSVVSGVRNTYS